MRRTNLIPILLTALLAVSSCAPALAEFCDVAQGPIQFESTDAVAQLLSLGEREALVQIDANNRVGMRECGWIVK